MMKLVHRFWPMGIRLQLTCWYTGVLAVIILCTGALVYKHLETSLESTADTALALRIQQIATEVTYQNNHVIFNDTTGNVPTANSTQVTLDGSAVDVDSSSIVRVLDTRGNVLRTTPAFRLLRVPEASITQPLHEQSWQETVRAANGHEIRIYSEALSIHGTPFAIVQVGESLQQLHAVLREEAFLLLLLTPVVLLLCALVSMWLASRAFAPIHRLTSTARQIGAGDLQQRVPIPQTRDEVHFLALTFNEMITKLDEAFKRQRRFVADASHELRTPVAAIRSKTDVALLQNLTTEDYVSVLQSINTESERLSLLISDLLALARADEGQAIFEQESIQLDVLVKTVAANAEVLAQQRDIKMRVRAEEPITIVGDEARLIQVVMNLLDNALTYTTVGGRVTLSAEQDQTSARVIVHDTGDGIAPEHLPHIFERFYRADPARRRKEGGSSGLGLAIVDWVVSEHGGSIQVESKPGKGSTFIVTLPLVPPDSSLGLTGVRPMLKDVS